MHTISRILMLDGWQGRLYTVFPSLGKQASKVIRARVGKGKKIPCNAIQFNSKLVGLQASRLTYWLLGQGHAQEAWQIKGGLHMDDHCQHGTCGFSAASRY